MNNAEKFEGETLEEFINRVHGIVFPGVEVIESYTPPRSRVDFDFPDRFVMFLHVGTSISAIAVRNVNGDLGLRRLNGAALNRWFRTNEAIRRHENPLFANTMFYRWYYNRYGARIGLTPGKLAQDFLLRPFKQSKKSKPSWADNADDISAIQEQLDGIVSEFLPTELTRHMRGATDDSDTTEWNGCEDLYKRFGGKITGIKRRDVKSAGDLIYVRVPLIQMPYEEQVRFAKANAANIIDYIMQVFRDNADKPSWAKVAGMVKFCDVSDITVLRSSEIEVIFSLRKELYNVLSS